MSFEVNLTSKAEEDAYVAFEHIRDEAPGMAERWLIGLFETILSFRELPER